MNSLSVHQREIVGQVQVIGYRGIRLGHPKKVLVSEKPDGQNEIRPGGRKIFFLSIIHDNERTKLSGNCGQTMKTDKRIT